MENYSGFVSVEYSNGDKYEGNLKEGLREGAGKYFYKNGNVYEGNFARNMLNGVGKLSFSKGGYYYGSFTDSKKEGEGVYVYQNGDRYSGFWKDGKKNGEGTYIRDENNMRLKGHWDMGYFTEGKWQLDNGRYFQGRFENNLPQGEGSWVGPDGVSVHGRYEQKLREKQNLQVPFVLNDLYNRIEPEKESVWISNN